MTPSKIEFKLGNFAFSAEGDEAWLSKQLDKVLDRANQLKETAAEVVPQESGVLSTTGGSTKTTLASFLSSKHATTNQIVKFLAVAAWLQLRGSKRMKPGDVAKALKDNNQTKLGNPSECLNQNVRKGLCEKDGKQFFVTEDGLKSLK